jgi:hypothetical protein
MLTLRYDVAGLGLTGRAAPGRQLIHITVGHLQRAHAARVTHAWAQVSFNGGKTFKAASVSSLGSGRFQINFTAPAGANVTLRVSAADAAGGSIKETILRAYGVAS